MLTLIESANADPVAPRSQTSAAYARLRRDILGGRLQPGEKLKINELAATLQVSPGAIREALSRLVPEQFVISRDQKGFVVAPLSIEDLEDLTDLRCEVESIAMRRAVERGGVEWESLVLASAHRLLKTEKLSPSDRSLEWVERHQAFHGALVSACGSRRLIELQAQLFQQSERYRGLSVHMEAERTIDEEHGKMVDAALSRDADRLVAHMVYHLRETTARIVNAARRGAPEAADPPPDLRRKRGERLPAAAI